MWLVPLCVQSAVTGHPGLGWRGLQGARQQPLLHLFFPALQAGVCADGRGSGRDAQDLRVWVEVAGQQGQV